MSDPAPRKLTSMTEAELLGLHRHEVSQRPPSVFRVALINGEFIRRGYTIIEEDGRQDRFVKKGKAA